jgi:hypothetical protein
MLSLPRSERNQTTELQNTECSVGCSDVLKYSFSSLRTSLTPETIEMANTYVQFFRNKITYVVESQTSHKYVNLSVELNRYRAL